MNWTTLVIHWLVSGAALYLTGAVVPGFNVRGFKGALITALLIGAANFFVRPILIVLTFPLTVITLGLFLWVVDAIILRLCAALSRDFEVRGWIPALMASVVLALTGGFLHWFFI